MASPSIIRYISMNVCTYICVLIMIHIRKTSCNDIISQDRGQHVLREKVHFHTECVLDLMIRTTNNKIWNHNHCTNSNRELCSNSGRRGSYKQPFPAPTRTLTCVVMRTFTLIYLQFYHSTTVTTLCLSRTTVSYAGPTQVV